MRYTELVPAKAKPFRASVIDEVSRLCEEHEAINLALGVLDLPMPDAVREAAIAALYSDLNHYTDSWGTRSLRSAIAEKTFKHLRVEVNPDTEVTVTCGTTEAMLNVMMAINEPGDEVILFEPVFDNYVPAIQLSGGVCRYVTLSPPAWSFDELELQAAFNSRTRAIVVNTPSNPTGKVFNDEELRFIADLCRRWDVLCVTDEVYEHMVFDGLQHRSMLQIDGMAERTIALSGLSKTFSMTGWRLGYVIAPAPLNDVIRNVHAFTTYCAPAPLQAAGVVALAASDDYYSSLCRQVEERRDILLNALEDSGFTCYKPSGALYLMADISSFGFLSDVEFVRFLIKEIGVAAVPGSTFYFTGDDGKQLLRFCFGKSTSTLMSAEKHLKRLVEHRVATT